MTQEIPLQRIAPSFISALVPLLFAAFSPPGTAKISLFCSRAYFAVIRLPPSIAVSIISVPNVIALKILFRIGKNALMGGVPGSASLMTAPLSVIAL